MSLRIPLIMLLLVLAAPLYAATPAEELTERLNGYETYQANFRQTVTDGSGALVQDSTGELRAKHNGLFYWHIEPPLEQFIAADGEEITVYDPDLRQVTVYPMDNKLSATPALLLSGNVGDLDQAYTVSRVEAEEGLDAFRLEPKNPDSLFLSLTLVFDGNVLKEMRLRDSLQQSSVIAFSDVVINAPIADEAFVVDYPEGVDVIRNRANP